MLSDRRPLPPDKSGRVTQIVRAAKPARQPGRSSGKRFRAGKGLPLLAGTRLAEGFATPPLLSQP